jgi:hypothetical protein
MPSRALERKLWLDLLAGSFKLIYKDKEDLVASPLVPKEKPAPGTVVNMLQRRSES